MKPYWPAGMGKLERRAGNGPVPVRGISRITSPESDTSAVKYRHPTGAGAYHASQHCAPACIKPRCCARYLTVLCGFPFYRAEPARTTDKPRRDVAMAASPSPTVRRKRLGIELRRLREHARLTCEEVGQRLDCSGTRISRIETGRISVRPGDVRELLEIYGVPGDESEALVQLAREARRKIWWHTYGRVLPTWFEPYIGLESEAAALRDFQCMVVPGLLQTKEYARAVLRTAPTAGPAEDIDRQVALRMDRQGPLDQQEPPDLWVVLSENVLRAQVGGPGVMRTQLSRLIDVAGQANVTLQVLPFGAAAQVQPISPFTILEFPQAADPAVVYLEHLTGSLFLENEDEVRRYIVVFDHLRAEALGTAPSIDLIAQVSSGLS